MSIKKAKGFSLVELMIIVAIIGILVLIAQPIYSDYIVRVNFTNLIYNQLLVKHRDLETELLVAGDGDLDALDNMGTSLCIPGTIQYSSFLSGRMFECSVEKNKLTFPLAPGNGLLRVRFISSPGEIPYIAYEERIGGKQSLWMDIRLGGHTYISTFVPEPYGKLYGAGNHKQTLSGLMKIIITRRGDGTATGIRQGVPFIVKRGETTPVLAERGQWYCAFANFNKYYYMPPASAMPTHCRAINYDPSDIFTQL